MITKAATWYSDPGEFQSLCQAAQRKANTVASVAFTARMVAQSAEQGLDTFLAPRQLMWLCTLAGQIAPPRRSP